MVTNCIKTYPFSLLIVLAVIALSVMPFPEIEMAKDIPFVDKWVHFVMYGGVAFVIWIAINVDAEILSWSAVKEEGGKAVSYYVVYAFEGREIGDMTNPANILAVTPETQLDLSVFSRLSRGEHTLVVTTVNRYRKESGPSFPVLLE
mgnify:CR=1 FL=1